MKRGVSHKPETLRKMSEAHQRRNRLVKEARIARRTAAKDDDPAPIPAPAAVELTALELKIEKMRQCEVCFSAGVLSGEIQGGWSVFNSGRRDAVREVLPVIDHERFALKHFNLCKAEAGSCLDRALVFLERFGRVSLAA
jgi:hypothetical protein